MRTSNWTPSIVPRADDQDVYLIVDDLGRLGRIWPEADFDETNFEAASPICSQANTATRLGLSVLIPRKDRPGTSRKT
jgi:hypothetical protein